MRRTILFCLCALLAVSVASDAWAQRRGEEGFGHARGGNHFDRDRGPRGSGHGYSPYGYGYAYLPYDSGDMYQSYDSGDMYAYPSQPSLLVQQPPQYEQPPAPPAAQPPAHPVVTEYKWPAAGTVSSPSDSEPKAFAIVLKNGSTLSASMILSSDDGLHYVDPDDRLRSISMSQVDRAATLKLNRARNLNLNLPAAE